MYVLGELGSEDREVLEKHLHGCEQCQDSVREFERIVLFDLPAVAVSRAEGSVPESLEITPEGELLARILENARPRIEMRDGQTRIAKGLPSSRCPRPWRKRAALVVTRMAQGVGWAVAAGLLLWIVLPSRSHSKSSAPQDHVVLTQSAALPDISAWQERIAAAEWQREVLRRKLADVEGEAHRDSIALSQLSSQYRSLAATNTLLQSDLQQEQASLNQKDGEVELARHQLNQESSDREALQSQLSEVYARFEKQQAEVTRLERVAATAPVRVPVSEEEVGETEAKDILGARDLHIVDVYDVDHSGKSSRVFGRVYYVNRSLLVFYAFDLSGQEKSHKAVAFQAWGFRQPQSNSAESLGLFYMDDARLNRWTLRVSDPELLSRIDTLFVTAEPPGGSHFPKGRHLLMASLAGPANHP